MERGKLILTRNLDTHTISISIKLVDGTVWLSKYEITELFDVHLPMVTANLKVLFTTNELMESDVTRSYPYTDNKGKKYIATLYNLDVVIALAFRMKGGNCRAFREWLRERVKRPIQQSKQPILIQLGKTSSEH